MHGSREWHDWGRWESEEKTNKKTHRKSGERWTRFFDGKISATQKVQPVYYIQLNWKMGLLHTAEQGGVVITSRPDKQGVRVYESKRGLTYLGRSSLLRINFQAVITLGVQGENYGDISAHTVNILTRWRLCHFPMGLRLWGPWRGHALINNIHSLRKILTQNFFHSPQLRMLDIFPVFWPHVLHLLRTACLLY